MTSSGIIYTHTRDWYRPSGSIWINPVKNRHAKVSKIVGMGLMLVSAAMIIFLFLPIGLVELRYALQSHENPAQADTSATQTDPVNGAKPVRDEAAAHGLSAYFSIFIPKIDAKANVIANVSTTNETEFDSALMQGVAHAKGTYFPGQGKNMFLFAHSTDSPFNFTRYNAVFYLLYHLTPGDQIVLYFLDKKYIYQVRSTVVADPADTSWLYKDFGTESLILQTCDPPGTTLHRLLVIATRVNN